MKKLATLFLVLAFMFTVVPQMPAQQVYATGGQVDDNGGIDGCVSHREKETRWGVSWVMGIPYPYSYEVTVWVPETNC